MQTTPTQPSRIRLRLTGVVLTQHTGVSYFSPRHRSLIRTGDYLGGGTLCTAEWLQQFPNMWDAIT